MKGRDRPAADPAAAERFYRTHSAAVFYVALSIVKHRQAAEDVMQSVFEKTLAMPAPLGAIRHPRAWIATVAKNQALNYLRDHGREYPASAADGDGAPLVAAADETAWTAEMEEILAVLNSTERYVFVMHGLHKFTYREIAGLLQIPAGTVQSTFSRARGKLRGALRDEGPKQGGVA